MVEWSQEQLLSLLLRAFICGVVIGVFYDFLRALRLFFSGDSKVWRVTAVLVTFITDVILWVFFGIVSIMLMYRITGGVFRGMTYVGMLGGAAIYYFTISRLTVKITKPIIRTAKKLLRKVLNIIIYPFGMIFRGVISLYRLTIGKIIGKIIRRVKESRNLPRLEKAPNDCKECGKEDLVYVNEKIGYEKAGRISFGSQGLK